MELLLQIRKYQHELTQLQDLEDRYNLPPTHKIGIETTIYDRILFLRAELTRLIALYEQEQKKEQFKQTLFSYINKTR